MVRLDAKVWAQSVRGSVPRACDQQAHPAQARGMAAGRLPKRHDATRDPRPAPMLHAQSRQAPPRNAERAWVVLEGGDGVPQHLAVKV